MIRRSRQFLPVIAIVLLLVVLTMAVGLWTRGVAATATAGKAQAEAGARSLAAMDATAAASQFGAAKDSFASVTRSLGPSWISAAAESIPWIGRQYTTAQSLAQIGSDGSLAGLELAEALSEAPPASATTGPAGRLATLLSSGQGHIKTAVAALSDAAKRAETLSSDGLVPPLARAVRSAQAILHASAPFLDRAPALLQLESYLLSGNHRILVVSQDGAELRPTGGWAGSFGIVNVGSAGVRLESYQDVFVLPNPPRRVTPPHGALQSNNFNFRNANWWLDFPTSAQEMLKFWGIANQPPVDALVVVDTVAMADLLAVVGPITVPRHKETFTSENLLDRLLYLVQVQKGGQPDRKNVLVELATELEKRVLESGPDDLAKSVLALGKAADAKHIQMYFADPSARAAVDALGWSGKVAPPSGSTDVVAISNAMNKPGKVNIALKKTISFEVQLQSDQSAETTLVLGYANTGPYQESLPGDFRDWLRVYRAPGTVFPNTNPDGSKPTTMTEFGFPAEARLFTLQRGQSTAVTLTARVPGAMRMNAAAKDGGDSQYQLYLVRQADLEDIPTSVTVTAPPGWRVTAGTARLIASGTSLPVTPERDHVRMAVPLSGDIALDVRLSPL